MVRLVSFRSAENMNLAEAVRGDGRFDPRCAVGATLTPPLCRRMGRPLKTQNLPTIAALLARTPQGMTIAQIVERTQIALRSVIDTVSYLRKTGRVTKRGTGKPHIWIAT